jgi:hypothetical protein
VKILGQRRDVGREDEIFVHPQNGFNGLILNWCIGGCWFTPAGGGYLLDAWGVNDRVSLGQRGTKVYSFKNNKASQTPWPCQYWTSTYCVHTVNTKTIRSDLNSLNTFTKCDTGSNKVKLPKVGSNAIVPAPTWTGP